MTREERKQMAMETLAIGNCCGYNMGRKKITFPIDNAFMYFDDKSNPSIVTVQKFSSPANIVVKNESTIDAMFRMQKTSLGVLNFASAKHPGGGFMNGSMAQEECLAYCSNLFHRQWPAGLEYYSYHRNHPSPLYSNRMFIDNVVFFRNSNFELVEQPVECKVLTSAAVNAGIARRAGIAEADIRLSMKYRMQKILDVFITSGCTHLVLGAFGCGVFGNSAYDIATIWKELLYDDGYCFYFEEICFLVLDTRGEGNFGAFEQLFS